MGKPTSDNGIPRLAHEVHKPRERLDRIRLTSAQLLNRKVQVTGGFGLPLSKGSMRSLNKIGGFKQTRGTETSQYPEERTSTETPLVVASERGPGQWRSRDNRKRLEKRAAVGESPVRVMRRIVLE